MTVLDKNIKQETTHKELCVIGIARVLAALNVDIVTNVPGSGSENILANYNLITGNEQPISFHEEVAFTIAHSGAILGKRSACLIKSHGLVKAGNSVMDAMSCGTNAGMVSFILSDKLGSHSDNIFDVEPFMDGLQLPFFRLKKENIFSSIKNAYEFSELWKLPVAILVDDKILNEEVSYTCINDGFKPVKYERNIFQNLVCPVFGKFQFNVLESKLNRIDWNSNVPPKPPLIDGNLPEAWQPTIKTYKPVFEYFKNIRGSLVCGDTGISSLFAFEPYSCVDITTYMGGSLPLAIGGYLAGHKDSWAISGDFAFISTGYLGLIEAKMRNIPLKVMIFKNDIAQTTGGQPISPDLLNIQLAGFENYCTYTKIDNKLEATLEKAHNSTEMQIIIIEC